ncbi:hypothetical protein [Pseudomonas aeruginosa]|uniref:hypothetical protein n=1 Tax=Pseudomonas aeruginosa TaxID=287 RepID=UPI003D277D9E
MTAVSSKRRGSNAISPELIERLGKEPDTRLAARFGVAIGQIKRERSRLKIPAFILANALPKDPEFMALLGNTPDTVLAKRYNCTPQTVGSIRSTAGIPPFSAETLDSSDILERLGKIPDKQVCSEYGLSKKRVKNLRNRLGIPAYSLSRSLQENPEFLALLGKESDDKLAIKFGCSDNTVARIRQSLKCVSTWSIKQSKKKEWLEKNLAKITPLLGTVSDADLARRFGGFPSRYARLRDQRGISAFQPEYQPNLSPELIERLGKEPDAHLVARFGVTKERVRWARTKLKIPAFILAEALPNDIEFMALLGNTTDIELAERYKCNPRTISGIRKNAGLPPFSGEAPVSPEILECLGKMPDSEVMAKYGLSKKRIQNLRKQHNIPTFTLSGSLENNPEFVSLLGIETDAKIAIKFGCSINCVAGIRQKLKCATTTQAKQAEMKAWREKNLADITPLLGTISDADLARRFGGFPSRYTRLRNKNGIPPFQQAETKSQVISEGNFPANETSSKTKPRRIRHGKNGPGFELPAEVLQQLGTVGDTLLSRESGISRERIRTYREWLGLPAARTRRRIDPAIVEAFGKMKDQDVADKFGLALRWVKKERTKLGIPGFKTGAIPGLVETLGTMPDLAVAAKFGISYSSVREERRKRGIRSFKSKRSSQNATAK